VGDFAPPTYSYTQLGLARKQSSNLVGPHLLRLWSES